MPGTNARNTLVWACLEWFLGTVLRIRPTSTACSPMFARLGPFSADFGQTWPDLGQVWSTFGRNWSNFAPGAMTLHFSSICLVSDPRPAGINSASIPSILSRRPPRSAGSCFRHLLHRLRRVKIAGVLAGFLATQVLCVYVRHASFRAKHGGGQRIFRNASGKADVQDLSGTNAVQPHHRRLSSALRLPSQEHARPDTS